MKLFIKRNTSPDKSCFTIFDEHGNEKYNASFTGSKSVSKLIVSDNAEKAVLKIRKIPIVGTHTFAFKAGKHHITFVMIISSNRILGYYYGNNWHINGEIAKGFVKLCKICGGCGNDNTEYVKAAVQMDRKQKMES